MYARSISVLLSALTLAGPLCSANPQGSPADPPAPAPDAKPVALTREAVAQAIAKGNAFLKSRQLADGCWSDPKAPGITALVLSAWMRSPEAKSAQSWPEYISKGYEYILAMQKDDGGIYSGMLASYMTSVSLMALADANKPAWTPQMLKARAFIIGQQVKPDPQDPASAKFAGGISYGGKDAPKSADLSNTAWAIQALHATRNLVDDGKNGKNPDLDWEAAIQFISRCQNSPESNDLPWAKNAAPEDRGGFVYTPESSRRGTGEVAPPQPDPAKVALRSYGSMSYSGLESLIYAKLAKDDPRVKAVIKWLGDNYSVKENPGMGDAGRFYYYQSMAKALTAADLDLLPSATGEKIDWRPQLIAKVLSEQQPDGSWVNSNGRWWENNPVLVTAYVVLTLDRLYPSLK